MTYKVYLRKIAPFNEANISMLSAALSDRERKTISGFSHEGRRWTALQSRYWLRHYLSIWAQKPLSYWDIVTDSQGKPQLSVEQQAQYSLHFNLSHSGDYLAIAVSDHAWLGVDIENTKVTRNWSEIAKHYFAESEYQLLQRLPETQQAVMFYRLWVLKEALMKARGTGLRESLAHYDFSSMLPCSYHAEKALTFVGNMVDVELQAWHCYLAQVSSSLTLAVICPEQDELPKWQFIDETQVN
ncbi:4'-phosphopantetheinyl transferase family protein [Shewanella mangrovi]|uniref:4'-phosphopantetheinyl transferase family protein n=1 Tax=Shewanella mangrovi TaxID=1515746 RepID=UPI0012E09DC3|nr:4'-phosphopantetheinyl transferase superfamily protein [Shewanella mangrovi]